MTHTHRLIRDGNTISAMTDGHMGDMWVGNIIYKKIWNDKSARMVRLWENYLVVVRWLWCKLDLDYWNLLVLKVSYEDSILCRCFNRKENNCIFYIKCRLFKFVSLINIIYKKTLIYSHKRNNKIFTQSKI